MSWQTGNKHLFAILSNCMKALQSESEQAAMQLAILASNILSGNFNTNKQNKIHCFAGACRATSFSIH